jgi:DNA ligase (NAD+)
MDIVGLGIKIVEQLVASGLVTDVVDLYSLRREDLLQLEGFAEKKADNLLAAIQSSKNRSLARLINALGIRGVGEVMADDLAKAYLDLDQLAKASIDDLQMLEGIGPNIAQAVVDWFARSANLEVLEKLHQVGVWPRGDDIESSSGVEQTLQGMTFVVTGTLTGFTRQEIKAFIESRGGKVTSSISKKTSYLIHGDSPGSKLAKARSLDVSILDEGAFMNLAGE